MTKEPAPDPLPRLSTPEGLAEMFPGVPTNEARERAKELYEKGRAVYGGTTSTIDVVRNRKGSDAVRLRSSHQPHV